MSVSTDVVISGKVSSIPSTGLTSDALPKVHKAAQQPTDAQIGVSTKNTLLSKTVNDKRLCAVNVHHSTFNEKKWYALRTTYGREQLAYDYISTHGGTAYWPTMEQVREIDGKRRKVRVSRISNILFAYGSLQEVQHFVYDNVNLPFLRFYYAKETIGREIIRRPLVVPESQMESLRIICAVDDGNISLVPQTDSRFTHGQQVRITQGRFAGVVGRVARYQGQQRVAVVVEGLFTIATAYVPSAFLEPVIE